MKNDSKAFIKFTEIMDSLANRLTSINGLMAVKDAFIALMPVVIAGSIAILFAHVVFSPTTGLALWVPVLAGLQPMFTVVQFTTMGMISVYLSFAVAFQYSKYYDGTNGVVAGFIAIGGFLILIPTYLTAGDVVINNAISVVSTDARGMFLAIIVGLGSTRLFVALSRSEKLKIKMPAGVPSNVSSSFEVLFPVIFSLFIISGIGFAFHSATGMFASEAIFQFIQVPAAAVMQHPLGIIALALMSQLLWSVGIHGGNLTGAVRNPLGIAALNQNADNFAAGEPMTEIFTVALWDNFASIGGAGTTTGLVIAIFLFCKRKDIRAIGMIALAPMFFHINEPLIFGIPIVLNPILIIPFVIAPIVAISIGYLSIYLGFMSHQFIMIPWTTPMFIDTFLTTGGSIGAVITQVVAIIAATAIYTPFVIIMNRQKPQDGEEEVAQEVA